MKRFLPPALALVLILGAGAVHGVWTNRWGRPADYDAAAAKLKNVPAVIGDWSAVDVPMDERQLRQAEAVGYLSRRYVKRGGTSENNEGASIGIVVLCGPSGPMAVHSPTICFTSGGWGQLRPERRRTVQHDGASQPDEFFETMFVKKHPVQLLELETLWSWNAGAGWRVAANPRLAFARAPYLYKLYVTRDVVRSDATADAADADPTTEFLQIFLPELHKAIGTHQGSSRP